MLSQSQLSKADSRILAQVFDPESGPTRPEISVDPSLSSDRNISSATLLAELKGREKEAIGLIESFEKSAPAQQSPQTKRSTYSEALRILNELIDEYPEYASARNNRAQLHRWRFGDRNLLCRSRSQGKADHEGPGEAVVDDLRRSIGSALPTKPQDPVSPAQGRLLAQAHTQLGAVFHAAAQDIGEQSSEEFEIASASISAWTKETFEQEASRLFYLGGLYGNEVAKALAVHTNPHAKLCGNIVKEAMRKEMGQT